MRLPGRKARAGLEPSRMLCFHFALCFRFSDVRPFDRRRLKLELELETLLGVINNTKFYRDPRHDT